MGTGSFAVSFDDTPGRKKIDGAWSSTDLIDFGQLASKLGLRIAGAPLELLPALKSASFSYDFDSKQLVLSAANDTAEVVLVRLITAAGSSLYVALVRFGLATDLGTLPVAGGALSGSNGLALTGVDLVLSADPPLTKAFVQQLNAVISTFDATLPVLTEVDLPSTVAVVVQISVAGEQHSLLLDVDTTSTAPAAPADAPQPAAALPVQQNFGPVGLNHLGAAYHDGRVWLSLDAVLTIGGLELSLLGLGLGVGAKPHLPIDLLPELRGIGVAFDEGDVEIAGSLVVVTDTDGNVRYDGSLVVSAAEFQLEAIGSYADFDSEPSMFAFALLDAPIGGPPIFFVTGLAAGFGANRALVIPEPAALPAFPLIAAVTGASPFAAPTNLTAVVGTMGDALRPEIGAGWFALGVRFTSFELIQSFALVVVKIGGATTEIDFLGTSAVAIPSQDPAPIAYAELGIVATFRPADGLLRVDGQLTPQSYVLSPSCHLTGGFAFRSWFADSKDGAKAGDFVVSLGGYHPDFQPPPWYPAVPRIGANWQVSDALSVKGALYFALTPAAVMAGASIDATWDSGDLNAWFSVDADFLLSWKPFHYEANVSVSLGVSYKVDLWFTSFTATVSIGAALDFWGPSFAGTASVDVYVFTIRISFGASDPDPTPISWTAFCSSFLPAAQSGAPDLYCGARVASGLVRQVPSATATATGTRAASGPSCVVEGDRPVLATSSVAPCSAASFSWDGNNLDPWPAGTGPAFGVGPVDVANGDFASEHVITLTRTDGGTFVPDLSFDFTPILRNVPAATWSAQAAISPDMQALNTGSHTIDGVAIGLSITPSIPDAQATPAIAAHELAYSEDPRIVAFSWPTTPAAPASSFDQTQAMSDLAGTTAIGVARRRREVLAALRGRGVDVPVDVDVSALAAHAADALLSAPQLCHVGERKVANDV